MRFRHFLYNSHQCHLQQAEKKFHDRIGCCYVIHPKNYRKDGNTVFLPAYMAGLI